MAATLDKTSTMDSIDRMQTIADSTTSVFIDFFASSGFAEHSLAPLVDSAVALISKFRSQVASRAVDLLDQLRKSFLSGERGQAPASPCLNKTKPVYEFVRLNLGVRMHGSENYARFVNGLGVDDASIGQNISRIYEVCRVTLVKPDSDLHFLYRRFEMVTFSPS